MEDDKDLTKLTHEGLMAEMEQHLRKVGSYAAAHVEELRRRLEEHLNIAQHNKANPEPPAKGKGTYTKPVVKSK